MKILFLSSFCLPEEEETLLSFSKVGLQNSIISFQRNLLQALNLAITSNDTLEVVNYYPIGVFPKYSRALRFKTSVSYYKNVKIHNIGFVNLQIVKQIILRAKVCKIIKKSLKQYRGDLVILQYDLLQPHLYAQTSIYAGKVVTSAIIADLPNEFGYKKNEAYLKSWLKSILGKYSMRRIHKLSCCALLTEQMASLFNLKSQDYVVIEGIANSSRRCELSLESYCNDKKIVQYFGSLYYIYGINNLLEAFTLIDDKSYELWLAGVGDAVSLIQKYSEKDSRIKYLGYLTQEEIVNKESEATVLVNPRMNNGEYTKYSFPSKIIEYMVSARPVIAYKLDGIPVSYYDYLVVPENNSINALKNSIMSICELTPEKRREMGINNREFVLSRIESGIVGEKLVNLLRNHRKKEIGAFKS